MKIYVLIISAKFPKTHKRAGDETFFIDKLRYAIGNLSDVKIMEEYGELISPKLHTIRGNYELWKKRINEVQKGNAKISIRIWTGKPYKSKQREITVLRKIDNIGIQKLERGSHILGDICTWHIDNKGFIGTTHKEFTSIKTERFAKNDGLSKNDFLEWFKNYDFSKNMAIIHFTNFRY